MTAAGLRQVVAEALATVGADMSFVRLPRGAPRHTSWPGPDPGFGIRHYGTGRKVYIVQTRMAGRVRTVTIGPSSVLTQHQAQTVARLVIAYARVGHDPATERQRIRSAPSFEDFLIEFWERWALRWVAKTYDVNSGYRRNYLDGAFPGAFIDAINEADVIQWFANLNSLTSSGAANQTLALLSSMFNRAEEWGYRLENTNPCMAVRYNRRKVCERFLSFDELARLGVVLAKHRNGEDAVRATVASAVALLILTGCRRGEVLGLQWGDVRGKRLKLRHGKTGPRTVWLGDEARAIIDALPRRKDIPWLFWNDKFRRPFQSIDHHWHEMREEAALGKLRVHDLRHTFASHAAMNKETLPMIGRLLGHSNPASTARYAHFDDEHVLGAAEQIGEAIERMLGQGAGLSSSTI